MLWIQNNILFDIVFFALSMAQLGSGRMYMYVYLGTRPKKSNELTVKINY